MSPGCTSRATGRDQGAPLDAALSPTTTPSRSSITRSATSSMAGSCVATMAVTPSLAHQAPQQTHDSVAGLRVQLAGRLIGQQQRRLVGQRAGDGDPLLLATRQLVRPMVRPIRQPHQAQQLGDPLLAQLRLRRDQAQRHLDVLGGGQDGQQPEGLEDEADALAPEAPPAPPPTARTRSGRRPSRCRRWVAPGRRSATAASSCPIRSGP